MFILDSHCDTPSQILLGRDFLNDDNMAHVDLPKLQRGEIDAVFFALYIPAELDEPQALEHMRCLYRATIDKLDKSKGLAVLTLSENEALKNKERGAVSVFLGLENGSPIGRSLERIQEFYDIGIRYITLCHSDNNEICDSCSTEVKRWNGLSPFGREVVAEMNRLGILVDVSHVSDETFYDVLECSTKPVVATHSCCRALSDHPRNMTDDMIKALAAKGGVIQINFYPVFLDVRFNDNIDLRQIHQKLPRPSYKLIADHIDHVVNLVGVDHVGIGSDFDGIEVAPDGLDDISMMPVLFEELRRRGYSESDLEKIASGNFFNAFSC